MSRPPSSRTIQVRVTQEEYEAIANAAKRDARTVSGYVRAAILGKASQVLNKQVLKNQTPASDTPKPD